MKPALGVLGLLTTLSITIYELRNSQLYELAMHRAKTLERRLGAGKRFGSRDRGGSSPERQPYIDQAAGKPMSLWLIPKRLKKPSPP